MNVSTPADLIDALRQRRLEMGMSQEAVGDTAGLEAHQICRYELRRQTPRMHSLLAWMVALGLAIEIVPAPPKQRRGALLGSTALTPPGRVVVARPAHHLGA